MEIRQPDRVPPAGRAALMDLTNSVPRSSLLFAPRIAHSTRAISAFAVRVVLSYERESHETGSRHGVVALCGLIAPEWLREAGLTGTRIAELEGHVSVFYLDRPGPTPGPSWHPRPPL